MSDVKQEKIIKEQPIPINTSTNNITQNEQINSKQRPILSIDNNLLFSLISVEDTSNLVQSEENLKKMIKELNKTIASKD